MEDNKVSSIWRTVAIISLMLLISLVLFLGIAMSQGNEEIENEQKCVMNVCASDIYDSYFYNPDTKICSCYEGSEKTYSQYLG